MAGTPGQELINSGGVVNPKKSRWNRAGVPVDGQPELISRSEPAESYEGASKINTPERVDLVVCRQDKTRLNIRYRVE